MTSAPVTVSEELTLTDALDRMYSEQIRHLPVVNAARAIVGTISTRDISIAASVRNLDPDKTLVKDAMTPAPHTCDVESLLVDVAMQMERERIGSVIITQGTHPVGIFTTIDALRALRSVLQGGAPVEPARMPREVSAEQSGAPFSPPVHPSKPSVRVTQNHGMVSWFLARL